MVANLEQGGTNENNRSWGGKSLQQKVHGIFTYEVNSQGKLLSLRGYWETDDPRNQMTEVDREDTGREAG